MMGFEKGGMSDGYKLGSVLVDLAGGKRSVIELNKFRRAEVNGVLEAIADSGASYRVKIGWFSVVITVLEDR